MKTINYYFPEFSFVEVVTIADLHTGNRYYDPEKLKEQIDYVVKAPNRFVILNGDLLEMATKSSVGDVYESLSPMEEFTTLVELLKPVKDRILCINTGNHERRGNKGDGVDIMKLLALQFNIPDRYTEIGATLIIRVGNGGSHKQPICYTVYVTHGSGGGRTSGGKINKLTALSAIIDCDVYVHSHVHEPAIIKRSFLRVDVHNGSVSPVDKLFVNTGASLSYGGYGEIAGYVPNCKLTPIIRLDGSVKLATANV